MSILLEVCVDSVASALAAKEGGAHRLELCSSLFEGGLTPSAGLMEFVCKHLSIATNVMIRPRGGDFLYSDEEFMIMQRDIALAKGLKADGVVFGFVTRDGNVDIARTKALADHARPLTITFHRAFDMVADPYQALESLISLGIDRVLTSGLESSAKDGIETIAALNRQAAGRIIIMPGGGINQENIATIVQATGCTEAHMSGRQSHESNMRYRNPRIVLGATMTSPEYSQQITSASAIRASLEALQQGNNPT